MLAACDSPRTLLELHDVAIAAQQVESLAGEARWLASELKAGDVTQNMAWVHQQALADDALKAAGELTKTAPASLREPQQQVAQLAARLQSHVTQVAAAAGHPEDLDALRREFDAIAKAAHPLAQQA